MKKAVPSWWNEDERKGGTSCVTTLLFELNGTKGSLGQAAKREDKTKVETVRTVSKVKMETENMLTKRERLAQSVDGWVKAMIIQVENKQFTVVTVRKKMQMCFRSEDNQ